MIGGGMSHKGMFRRKVGNNFRYLHDEISGGENCYSKLKCVESYTGDCINLEFAGDYGFIDNLVEIPNTVQQKLNIYDQLGNTNAIDTTPTGGYSGTQNNYHTGTLRQDSLHYLTNTLKPFTFIYVVETPISENRGFFSFGNGQAPGRTSVFLTRTGTEDVRFWLRQGSNNATVGITWLGGWNFLEETKIIVCTYDGSGTAAGVELYRNDMITPLTKTITHNSTVGLQDYLLNARAFVGGVSDENNALYSDIHLFNTVLNESDRSKAKEILEQYYTFS